MAKSSGPQGPVSDVWDEAANGIDGALGFGEEEGQDLKNVDHVVPDFFVYGNAGLACALGKAPCVIEEDFGVACLEKEGREAAEIGKEGGSGVWGCAAQVEPGHVLQGFGLNEGIAVGACVDGFPAACEVEPGGEEDSGCRQGLASIAEAEEGGEDEIAAGGVADEGDVGGVALLEELEVGGVGVVDGGGPGVLGGEPVVEEIELSACRPCDARSELAVTAQGAGDKTAAVEVEEGVIAYVGWSDVLGWARGEGGGGDGDVTRGLHGARDAVHVGAERGDIGAWIGSSCAERGGDEVDDLARFRSRHRV